MYKRIIFVLTFCCLSTAWAQTDSILPQDYHTWGIDRKVDYLLKHMTFSEKVEQMNTSPRGGRTYRQPRNERFDLPGFVSCDGPRGVKKQGRAGVCCFPTPLLQAATWDPERMRHIGQAFAEQLIHLESNQLFAPGINIVRHPQAGRNSEYFGEDPYLTGRMAAAMAAAIQRNGCISTPKHYACNPFETGRFRVDITVPERVLREIYLPAFRMCVQQGGVKSVMTAYNSINGHFASANTQLFDILYDEWGFKGYAVSDYNAAMESAAAALNAGTHVEMPGWKEYTDSLIQNALDDNQISKELFEKRLRRILKLKLNPGFHDPGKPHIDPFDLRDQQKLACDIASEGIVLLKNADNRLPLSKQQSVALMGPFADSDMITGNQGSSTVRTDRVITVRQAINEQWGGQVVYAKGCDANHPKSVPVHTAFQCKAEYYNNLNLQGEPALKRQETSIQKMSFTGSGAAARVEGISGQAFGFGGQTSLKVGTFPSYAKKDEFTWSFWTYLPDQFPDENTPLLSSYIWMMYELALTPHSLSLRVRNQDRSRGGNVSLSCQITPQLWTHVAVVRRDGKLAIYINGEKQDEQPYTNAIPAAPLAVGGSYRAKSNGGKFSGVHQNANCRIDEIALYDRALTEQEINAVADQAELNLTDGRGFYLNCEEPQALQASIETYDGIEDVRQMSARWTGVFTPKATGKYHFTLKSNGGVRFIVDGKRIIDQWQEAWVEGIYRECWLNLKKGRKYDLRIEYANHFGAQRTYGGYMLFEYSEPVNAEPELRAAADLAAQQDAAVVVVGTPPRPRQGEADDKETHQLTAYQNELIQAVSAANPHTVVVLCTAGGVDMRSWIDDVPCVVEAFYPGQEGGYAIADILSGAVNPSGKLPVSYPVSVDQLQAQLVQPQLESSLCAIGYRMFDKTGQQPLFPFGFGLSYTTFEISDLNVQPEPDYNAAVTFTVTNTGERAGAKVAQVYVSDVECSEERPVKELKGFKKVYLRPGQSETVTVELDKWAFSFFSETQDKWIVEPGDFEIQIGNSSRDIVQTEIITWP